MADGYDRYDNEGGGGGSFVMGLLTGTVLGAGLGMLFAPKAGSELRGQLSEQAGNLANTASEGYRKATEAAGDWADRGREMYDKAKDAVARGAEEADRYVRDATSGSSPATAGDSLGSTPGSSFSSGSGYTGSGSSDFTRGSGSSPSSSTTHGTGGTGSTGGSTTGGPRRS
jgi:gas vesicle protein